MASKDQEHEVSDRGLIYMPLIDVDGGAQLSVSESSNAERPCIWLKVQDPNGPGEVCVSVPVATALRLAENIEWLVAHHRMAERED